MQEAVCPAACRGGRTLSALVAAQAHTQFLNSSTPCTATWHLLCKPLIPSKWGRYDTDEWKWWKNELTWAQGAVFSSQVSVGAYTDFCLSDTTKVSAREDGCLSAPGEPDGATWPSLVSVGTLQGHVSQSQHLCMATRGVVPHPATPSV